MTEKLGRNPFNKGSQSRKSARPSRAEAASSGSGRSRTSKPGEPFLRRTLLRALSWRVESFSFWNYSSQGGSGSFSFFCAGLRNHRRDNDAPKEIRLALTRRKPIALSLVSLRIHSA